MSAPGALLPSAGLLRRPIAPCHLTHAALPAARCPGARCQALCPSPVLPTSHRALSPCLSLGLLCCSKKFEDGGGHVTPEEAHRILAAGPSP